MVKQRARIVNDLISESMSHFCRIRKFQKFLMIFPEDAFFSQTLIAYNAQLQVNNVRQPLL